MPELKFDKQKYLRMMQSQGAAQALTQLQKDIIDWEIEAFEGRKGYNPVLWRELHGVREFSRELWSQATLGQPSGEEEYGPGAKKSK